MEKLVWENPVHSFTYINLYHTSKNLICKNFYVKINHRNIENCVFDNPIHYSNF